MRTWHKSKPKMVGFPEILQGLHKLKKQGVMGMKLAHFSIQLVKVQWVAGSSYNVAADDQRCMKGTEIGKKVPTLWLARLGTVRQHVAFDTVTPQPALSCDVRDVGSSVKSYQDFSSVMNKIVGAKLNQI